MAALVSSLKDIQELLKETVGAEGVEVQVEEPLTKLSDAPAMANLLKKLQKDKKWMLSGANKLKPLVPVALTVEEASETICAILPYFDGKTVLTISTNARELRRLGNRLHHIATDLQRLGKDVTGLRAATRDLADELLEVVKCLRAGARKTTIEFVHLSLSKAKKSCADLYNSETILDSDEDI